MAEIDPEVQPQSFRGLPAGGVEVTVHQIVRAREGSLLSDGMVLHTYTFSGDRVAADGRLTGPDEPDVP